MKFSLILIIFMAIFPVSSAQDDILLEYINTGIKNNLALKQKDFSLKKSMAALNEAEGTFYPSIDISARYTRAEGGRMIDLPVGDLMNPVYSGLNQILGTDLYPQIPNQQINFLRKKEHDTKISFVQPIFQPKIFFNYQIKSDLVEISKSEKQLYRRELIAEIKKAYYNYNKTCLALDIYNDALQLVKENLRVSKSLYENQKVTRDFVYRAEAELSEIKQKISEAENNKNLSKNYFNFILNRPLDTEIILSNNTDKEIDYDFSLKEVTEKALHEREEFKQVSKAIEIADESESLANSNILPSLVFAADYGYQGEEYKFNDKYDYWMASLVLNWNLFKGFQDKAKAEQSEYEKNNLESKYLELQKKIALQVSDAYHNYETTKQSLETAELREKSSAAAFDIVQKKYKEGMASQIEFIDARTSLTQAKLNKVITTFDLLIKKSELEKLTLTDKVENYLQQSNSEN